MSSPGGQWKVIGSAVWRGGSMNAGAGGFRPQNSIELVLYRLGTGKSAAFSGCFTRSPGAGTGKAHLEVQCRPGNARVQLAGCNWRKIMRKYAIVLLSALCIPFSASVKLQAQAGLPEPPGPHQAVLPIRISVGHSGLPAVPSVAGIFPRLSGAKQESLGAPLEGSPAAPLWLAMVHPEANEAVGPPAALLEEAGRDSVAALYRQIYELVLQERWPEAHVMLSRFLQEHPDSRWADDAAFWRCYTLQKLGKPLEEVFSCYEKFVATYTDSRWRDDAKAAMIRIGEQLVRQGKKGLDSTFRLMKTFPAASGVIQADSARYSLT